MAVQALSKDHREDRRVCVMFTDLVGSTELFGALGDEAAHEVVSAHFDLITAIAISHRGRVVKNLGDGLMVVFGPAQDAVNAALEMQQAVFTEGQLRPPALGLRVGLGAGEAIEDAGDFFGGPVILASRLCARSSPGQILATAEVADLARAQAEVAFVETGSLALKGIADPVPSCEVLPRGRSGSGISHGAPVAEVRRAGLALPNSLRAASDDFVGRATELGFLADRVAAVDDGITQLVFLEGEPGAGKSRLAAEFARRQHAAGYTVLFGRCDEDASRAFQPFAEAIEFLVGATEHANPITLSDEWQHDLVALEPALAAGAVAPATDVERRAMFEAVKSIFALAAGDSGLLLVLDDLHLADRSTLTLLRHLCRSATARLLIVATFRADDIEGRPLSQMLSDFRRLDLVHSLRVGDMGAADTERLVAAWAGATPTRELSDALWRRTQGNPFYTREVLRFLLASEEIVTDGRHVRAAGSLENLRLPETVRAALDVRLRRLSPACLRMLGAASTVGDEFSVAELAILDTELGAVPGSDEVPTLALLEEASVAGVIGPVRRASGVFRFDHGLVRQAFHDDLSSDLRSRLHLALARHYESQLAADMNVLAEIAHHYAEAASLVDTSVVASWCERAGDEAMRRLAYEDAAVSFERALGVLQRGRSSERDRVRLLRRLGSSQITAGAVAAGRERLREAASLAESNGMHQDLGDIALSFAGEGVGVVLFEVGIVDGETIDLLERALAAMEPGDSAVRAKLLCHLAAASLFSADPERHLQHAEQATAMARRLDDPATLSYVLSRASWAGWRPGETRLRLEVADETIALAQGAHDRMSEALGEMVRQISFLEMGDRERASRSRSRLGALATSSQDPYQHLYIRMLDATQALSEGRFADAEELAGSLLVGAPERSAGGGFEQPSAGVVSSYATQLASIRMAQGRLSELRPVIEQFARDLPALPVWRFVAVLAQLLEGDTKAGLRFRSMALEDFPTIPHDMFFGTAAMVAAAGCRLVMDPVCAASLYDEIKELSGFVHTHVGVTTFGAYDRPLGELAMVKGNYDEALQHFEAAQAAHRNMRAEFPRLVTDANIAEVYALRRGPGDRDLAEQILSELVPRAEQGGHGYALMIAASVRSLLDGVGQVEPASRVKRLRAAGRTGARRSTEAARTAFTRSSQLTLRSILGVAGKDQVERRLATPAAQRVLFATVARSFRPERALGFEGTLGYSLRFTDPTLGDVAPAEWHIEVGRRRAHARPGPADNPAVLVRIKATDFVDLLTGELGSITALLDGRAVVEGDFELASRMVDMFGGIPSG